MALLRWVIKFSEDFCVEMGARSPRAQPYLPRQSLSMSSRPQKKAMRSRQPLSTKHTYIFFQAGFLDEDAEQTQPSWAWFWSEFLEG